MSLLLCFSGQIGSGKSSISAAVAKCLDCQLTSFGDYLRAEIRRSGGDPLNRQVLQDFGQRRISEDPVVFCREVLAFGGFQPGQHFVLDGIRHVTIFDVLKIEARPSKARLLFLAASDAARFARVKHRTDSEDLDRHRSIMSRLKLLSPCQARQTL